MSGYRPWDPPAAPAPDADRTAPQEAPADETAEAPYTPWRSGQAAKPEPVASPKEFAAPPGLAAAAPKQAGARGMRLAAALLLFAGGFLVIGGIAGAAWSGGIATFMDDAEDLHDPADIRLARTMQTISIAVALLAGAPALAAGAGILYRQPWAFGAAIAAASLQLFIVPIGTFLGILVLALVTRRRARWWFA